MSRLPDFVIIGAAKCGTTTLYEYLVRHPRIFMSTPKEPEFFAREEMFAKGLAWYQSLFDGARAEQLCGEASTKYTCPTRFPLAAPRLAAQLPDAKLIYMMREPVARAYSYYAQELKTAQRTQDDRSDTPTFEEKLEADETYVDAGDYLKQINLYLEHYPRDRFLFLLFEQFIADPQRELRRITDFLEIEPFASEVLAEAIRANIAADHLYHLIRAEMTRGIESLPGAGILKRLVPYPVRTVLLGAARKVGVGRRVERRLAPKPFSEDTRQTLIEHFRPRNALLGEFLGIDLAKEWGATYVAPSARQPSA